MARSLEEIFQERFAFLSTLRPDRQAELSTNAGQAEYLGVSPAQLSRVRAGKRKLTEGQAAKFARKLLPDGGAADQRKFALELMVVSRESEEPTPWALHNVADLFQRLARPKSLLCVEYRDWPRAYPEGKYRDYASCARQAVDAGCSFAMFQPFGAKVSKGDVRHTTSVTFYLEKLRDKVREACVLMRGPVDATRPTRAGQGIVLYERNADEPFYGSGIQTRLFYAEIPEGDEMLYEVWEWVAADGRDLFVRRDAESAPREVIAEQFFPVVEYWRNNNCVLPSTNLQLKHAVADYAASSGARMNKSPWTVWETGR